MSIDTRLFLNDIIAYINTKGLDIPDLKKQSFVGTNLEDPIDEAILRTDPGNPKETVYMDLSSEGSFNFSVYTKSLNQASANRYADEILSVLDLPSKIALTDNCFVKIVPITYPAFVQKTDKLEYIFTASLGLEYFKEG